MKRNVRIRWPQLDIALTVQLLDEMNPALTNALWRGLPLLSIQSHAMVAGEQIYFPTRLRLDEPQSAVTEPMDQQQPGRINFEPYFQYVSLNYGPMTEPVPAWPLGQVDDTDLPKLPSLGQQVWQRFIAGQTDLLVVVERADQAPLTLDLAALTTPHRAATMPGDLPSWQAVLAHIEQETDAIWVNEPEDVQALRLGVQTSDAGVNGQYFSPWVMVSGLVRSLAIVDLAALARLCQNSLFTSAQLQVLLHEMLTVLLGVVSYFGLPQLGATLAAVDQVVDQIEDGAAFARFVAALQTYVNRYNLWLYQTFPWRLGVLFPKATVADAQAILNLADHPAYRQHYSKLKA